MTHKTPDKENLPYDQWPGKVQVAFQTYRAMIPDPNISKMRGEPGMTMSLTTYFRWSEEYNWKAELDRLARIDAELIRKKEDDRRRGVIENARNGMANGLQAIGLALSGICPLCKGTGVVSNTRAKEAKHGQEKTCQKCKGDGLYDSTKAPTKSLAILLDRVEKAWGYTESVETTEDTSAITPAEQKRLATEMMQRAGFTEAMAQDEAGE
jgi:hypothetical protein